VVLRGALPAGELEAAAANPAAWADAAGGGAVAGCVEELLGAGYRLDAAAGLLPQLEADDPAARQLTGGGCSDDGRRLRYWFH
jgi:hypothetical protein